ncbi:MAG: hypothetical protein Q9178_004276 [Gyalolechia marmorata]
MAILPVEVNEEKKGNFFFMPRELRNEVYRHLSLDGSLTLLRTNRQIYVEMRPIVEKHALRSIHVQDAWASTRNWGEPETGVSGQRVQNWEIFWSWPRRQFERSDRRGYEALRRWSGVARGECTVHVEGLGMLAESTDGMYNDYVSMNKWRDVMPLGGLALFETVVFRDRDVSLGEHLAEDEERLSPVPVAFRLLSEDLEVFLGASEVGCDVDGWYLRFQSRPSLGRDSMEKWWLRVKCLEEHSWGET